MQVDKCPEHKVDLIPTRNGAPRLLCPQTGCDFHYMKGPGMTKVTIPIKASKEERAKAIEQVAQAKKQAPAPGSKEARKQEATAPGVVKPSKPERKAKIPKELNAGRKDDTSTVTEKPTSAKDIKKHADKELDASVEPKKKEASDPNMLTVSDVARELGIDPKAARAKLRRDGSRATEGRWPKVRKGSKEHADLIKFLSPDTESKEDAEEEEVEEEEDESNEDADEESSDDEDEE